MLPPEEVLFRHLELAVQFGNQADRVVAQARENLNDLSQTRERTIQQAVSYARSHVFERSAVRDERAILESILTRGMGQLTYEEARAEFERGVKGGDFVLSHHAAGRAASLYTTAEMVQMERVIIEGMRAGNQRDFRDPMLVSHQTRIAVEDRHPELNRSQVNAVDDILVSREKFVGLEGLAGTGKTTALRVIREGAEVEGYRVEGFAPTSRAAQKLAEAGIQTTTLQMRLARGAKPDTGERRLYILDESSLASTRQMYDFAMRLHRNDRVLLVGDTRQHEAVEAGRPFAQLQESGMKTIKLDEIVRQRDPDLKRAVELLARGQVGKALVDLDGQGRIHEYRNREERIEAIAHEYVRSPEGTLVVSPDNRSRIEINSRIRTELQREGRLGKSERVITTLNPRQEMTGADRSWAQQYQINDILRFSRTSRETGINKGEYARVVGVDSMNNLLSVSRADGTEKTYNPRRQMGVSVYREMEKPFSIGDRIQFTAPVPDVKIANRELGTVQSWVSENIMRMKLDTGRELELDYRLYPHLDHGYAVTSHSGQGQTADRVLIHVDTGLAARDLLNSRMAYVAVSRGQWDAQIFTDSREALPIALGRDVSHASAYQPEPTLAPALGAQISPEKPIAQQTIDIGLGL